MGLSGLRMAESVSRYGDYVGIGLYRIRSKRPSSGKAAFLSVAAHIQQRNLGLRIVCTHMVKTKNLEVKIRTISAYRNFMCVRILYRISFI
jgi:hypothetical protein